MYTPLAFLNSQVYPCEFGQIWPYYKSIIEEEMNCSIDVTEDECITFMAGVDFLDIHYEGKYSLLNKYHIRNLPRVMALSGLKVEDIKKKNLSLSAEYKDFTLSNIIFDKWAKNKQVYKLDIEFAEALLHTDDLTLSREQLEHLPCQTFYVDLESCPQTDPIEGAFVNVMTDNECAYITIYLLSNDLVFFSHYNVFKFEDNHITVSHKRKEDTNVKEYLLLPEIQKDSLLDTDVFKEGGYFGTKYTRYDITMLIIQLICYFSVKEPDITESETTKTTYKKRKENSSVKNKFSEVQSYDIGVRIGSKIRTAREKEIIKYVSSGKSTHKSPIPHYRSAHWHRYWTGEGRKNLELRWIEPILVGFTDNKIAKDATIHMVE